MTQPPSASSGGAAPLSLGQRCLGILVSPKSTFESVVSWPRWVGVLVLTTLVIATVVGAFMFSDVGRDVVLEQAAKSGAPAEAAEMQAKFAKFIAPIAILIFSPVVALASAGILMGVFAITGGTASFKQVLAVVVHAGIVSTAAGIVNTGVNYIRATGVNITSLAGVAQAFPEKSFMAAFLGTFDLVTFWWLFVLAIGLAVLYRRRTQSIFIAFIAVHLVISLAIGGIKTAMGG
jgi:hypothetical protein